MFSIGINISKDNIFSNFKTEKHQLKLLGELSLSYGEKITATKGQNLGPINLLSVIKLYTHINVVKENFEDTKQSWQSCFSSATC